MKNKLIPKHQKSGKLLTNLYKTKIPNLAIKPSSGFFIYSDNQQIYRIIL